MDTSAARDKSKQEEQPIKQFDFYEFAGLLSPGAILLVGLSLIYPQLGDLLLKNQTSVGDLGLFVILAYVAGHLSQSFSSIQERLLYEKVIGGKPSVWIFDIPTTPGRVSREDRLRLSPVQTAALRDQLPQKLGLKFGSDINAELSALSDRQRTGIVRQIYACVNKAGRAELIDRFTGNYGLFRALSASLLAVLALLILNTGFSHPGMLLALLVAIGMVIDRMYHFSRLYAEQLVVEFLQIQASDALPVSPPLV